MLKKILSGYRRLLSGIIKIVAILAVCVAFGFALVYPLWYFAVTFPSAYTVAIFSLFITGALALYLRKIFVIMRSDVAPAEKRKKLLGKLAEIAKFAVIICGICLCVWLVISGARLVALPVLLAAVALYGVFAYGTKDSKSR